MLPFGYIAKFGAIFTVELDAAQQQEGHEDLRNRTVIKYKVIEGWLMDNPLQIVAIRGWGKGMSEVKQPMKHRSSLIVGFMKWKQKKNHSVYSHLGSETNLV